MVVNKAEGILDLKHVSVVDYITETFYRTMPSYSTKILTSQYGRQYFAIMCQWWEGVFQKDRCGGRGCTSGMHQWNSFQVLWRRHSLGCLQSDAKLQSEALAVRQGKAVLARKD